MKNSSGQTLIEIVIAIGLVSVVLIGLVSGSIAGLKAARVSRERARATQIAQTEIEEVRRDRDTDTLAFFGSQGQTTTTVGESPVYTVVVTKTLNASQMEVLVEVSWTDGASTYHVNQQTFLNQWQ